MTKLTLRIYRDKKKQLRWTLIGANREKLCSGEGYKRRVDLESTIVLAFLGRELACGSKRISTVLEFRTDIRLEDLTMPLKKHRCKGSARCR